MFTDGTKGVALGPTRTGSQSSAKPERCPPDKSRYAVELTTVNHRRGRYCWTIKEAGAGCPPGLRRRNTCCTEIPEAFVLRNIGKDAVH